MNNNHTPTATFDDLAAHLASSGWEPGAPATISAKDRAIDRHAAHRLVCPGCRRRGMKAVAMHQGTRYTVLARCPNCPGVEIL